MIKYFTALILAFVCLMNHPVLNAQINYTSRLDEGWTIFSSQKTESDGSTISKPEFILRNSFKTNIPKTVLAALVENGVYKDPYFGMNLSKISYEPFRYPWWYRKEFLITETGKNINYSLTLEGINYKANLWLNGNKVAGEDIIEGPYSILDFNVTKYLVIGKNVIAIEVIPPTQCDFALGFVDWNPSPPDRSMGLWRGIKLKKTGTVSLDNVFINTELNDKTLSEAELTITGTLKNFSNKKAAVLVKGSFDNYKKFSKIFTLESESEIEFKISASEDANLKIVNPHLWWPYHWGDPYLYTLSIKAIVEDKISDSQNIKFGIRKVEDYLNENGHRGYKINGKKIVIKGGGWTDDLMLNDNDQKVIDQIKYAKQMNLNAIRLEGFWGRNETIYNAADENGILIMVGWNCEWDWKGECDREETKYSCVTAPKDIEVVSREINDQVRWLRNHPSIFVWALGSDKYPVPELMKKITSLLNKTDTTRPRLISAAGIKISKAEDLDSIYVEPRVKMLGPYDYEPPVYWYVDSTHGGAYGFNTETGPGPQVPPIESLKKMLPAKNLWPVDSVWNYHCGKNNFGNLDRFIDIFNNRYGEAKSVEEFSMKCQMSNYEAMRPMFESFSVNKFNSTGVIQWMFNSAFPEMYWQLFDSYLMPTGAFYGAMKGCQPLNLVYNYKDKNIYVVNDYLKKFDGLKAEIKILTTDSKMVYENEKAFFIKENSSEKIMDLPELTDASKVFFINLELKDNTGNLICNNFYWVSSKGDSLDFEKSQWYYTPMNSYADLREINNLPKIEISYSEKYSSNNNEEKIEATLENNSDKLAFFIELKVADKNTGESFLPVYWTDNYVSLLPHSRKKITGTFRPLKNSGTRQLIINGWNVSAIKKEKI